MCAWREWSCGVCVCVRPKCFSSVLFFCPSVTVYICMYDFCFRYYHVPFEAYVHRCYWLPYLLMYVRWLFFFALHLLILFLFFFFVLYMECRFCILVKRYKHLAFERAEHFVCANLYWISVLLTLFRTLHTVVTSNFIAGESKCFQLTHWTTERDFMHRTNKS